MKISILVGVFSAILLLTTSPSSTAEEVAFNFDWNSGWVADVETSKTRIRRYFLPDALPVTQSIKYVMTATPTDDQIKVTYQDINTTDQIPQVDKAIQTAMQFGGFMVDHNLTKDGELIEIANPEETIENITNLIEAYVPEELPEQIVALLKHMITADNLSTMVSSAMDGPIGQWRNQVLEIGEDYGGSERVPFPALAGSNVMFDSLIQLEERVPCTTSDKEISCVKITVYSAYDVDDIQRVAQELAEKLGDSEEAQKVNNTTFSEFSDFSTIITNPQTLQPYLYEHKRTIDLESKSAERDGRIDSTRSIFKYR